MSVGSQARAHLDAKRGRSRELDCVRGVAILAVVGVHTANAAWSLAADPAQTRPFYFSVLQLGTNGVQLFFVLSGWLLASLYDDNFAWRPYAVRRMARIWPLWLAFLIFFVVEASVLHAGPWHSPAHDSAGSPIAAFLLTAVFVGGWVVVSLWTIVPGGWSIYCEVAHYAAYPLLRRVTLTRLFVILIALRIVVEGYGQHYAAADASNANVQLGPLLNGVTQSAGFFITGMIAFRLCASDARAAYRGELVTLLRSAWGALLVCAALGTYLRVEETAASVAVFLGIALALSFSPFATPVAKLGRVSYFIYFAHFVLLSAAANLLARPSVSRVLDVVGLRTRNEDIVLSLLMATVVITISYLLGRVSMRLFEGPINRRAHLVTA